MLQIRRWASLARNLGPANLPRILWSEWTGRSMRIVAEPSSDHPRMTLRAGTSDIATFVQVFREREYSLPLRGQVRTIIDAGANVGLSSLYFATRFPQARIIAIEPEPANFELLRANIVNHRLIAPVWAALAAEDGEVRIVDPGQGNWAFRTWGHGPEGATGVAVPALSLDSILGHFGLDHVDVLKMDIEGAEKEVLEHCAPWIDRIGVLVVELHDRFRPGCSAAFAGATRGFDLGWTQGELTIAARADGVDAPAARPIRRVATPA